MTMEGGSSLGEKMYVKAGDRVITEIPQSLNPGATVQLAGAEGKGSKGGKGKGKK